MDVHNVHDKLILSAMNVLRDGLDGIVRWLLPQGVVYAYCIAVFCSYVRYRNPMIFVDVEELREFSNRDSERVLLLKHGVFQPTDAWELFLQEIVCGAHISVVKPYFLLDVSAVFWRKRRRRLRFST